MRISTNCRGTEEPSLSSEMHSGRKQSYAGRRGRPLRGTSSPHPRWGCAGQGCGGTMGVAVLGAKPKPFGFSA